jgi:uncharacterized protein
MTLELLPPLDPSARGTPIRIASTKYDGSLHYEYWGRLIDQHGGVIRVVTDEGTPSRSYRGEGLMRAGMTQLFFTDRWYNVFHNYAPVGRLGMHWYANIGTPARIEGDTLRWVDLDLDLMHTEARGLFVDDEDEFAEHQVQMAYPREVIERAQAALDELLGLAHGLGFPLDHDSHVPGPR